MGQNEFIIVHDTEKYKDCLYFVCGTSREKAEQRLDRILNNPSEREKEDIAKGYCNFRIKEVEAKYCWWNNA